MVEKLGDTCFAYQFGLISLIVIVGFPRQFCFHYDTLRAMSSETPIATAKNDERCKARG